MRCLQADVILRTGLVTLAGMIVAAGFGCRPQGPDQAHELKLERDRACGALERLIREDRDPAGRAATALVKLKDGIPDHVPLLVSVKLGCVDDNEPMLFFTCLDEDRNLRGICVREEWTDPNGRTTAFEERYPVYIAWRETNALAVHMFPVELRGAGQRKNEEAWKDYIILVLEDLARAFVYKRPSGQTTDTSPNQAMDRKRPPIWISVPGENKVRVSMSVYDTEGHESEPLEVAASPRLRRMFEKQALRELRGHPGGFGGLRGVAPYFKL